MAYFNQDKKEKIQPLIKALLAKYKMKGSLSVRHHSTVVLTLKSGELDILNNFHAVQLEEYNKRGGTDHWGFKSEPPKVREYIDVNTYHVGSAFTGEVRQFMLDAMEILNIDNYDHSDVQSDYFNVGHYVDIRVGTYDKFYEYTGKK